MRGGISIKSKRYAQANDPKVPGYDPTEPTKYIMHLEANILYYWAISCHSEI